MKRDIRIRSLGPGDIEDAITLFRSSVRQIARRDYSDAQVRAWAPDDIDKTVWEERLHQGEAWAVDEGGTLAGFAVVRGDGCLDMLFVHPLSQRRGVASALLTRAETSVRQWGGERLYAEVSLTARTFFLARGFRELARQTVELRGQSFVNFRMEKPLHPSGDQFSRGQ